MPKADNTQYLATVLAYTLPILQFLFSLLNADSQKFFIFKDYFLVISVMTAAISYVAINLVRENHWFEWTPFQSKRKRKWQDWRMRTNSIQNIFTEEEVKQYIIDTPQPLQLFTFRSNNVIQRLLLPAVFIFSILFFIVGFISYNYTPASSHWSYGVLSLLQVLSYMLMIILLVIIFALFYYTKRNQSQYNSDQASLFERAILLARRDNSFGETQPVVLLAHRDFNGHYMNKLYSFLITVGGKCYIVTTDNRVEKIILINQYASVDDGYAAFIQGADSEQ